MNPEPEVTKSDNFAPQDVPPEPTEDVPVPSVHIPEEQANSSAADAVSVPIGGVVDSSVVDAVDSSEGGVVGVSEVAATDSSMAEVTGSTVEGGADVGAVDPHNAQTIVPPAEEGVEELPLAQEAPEDENAIPSVQVVTEPVAMSSASDDEGIPLGELPPLAASASINSVSAHPIQPADAWMGSSESMVVSDSQLNAEVELPMAEEVDPTELPSNMFGATATEPTAATPTASPPTSPETSSPSSAEPISSDIHANLPPAPAAESSNLFGPFLTASGSDSSHIIGGHSASQTSSDSALSFLEQYRPSTSGANRPPQAEDVSGVPFHSPADEPDYGAMPLPVPEASNILADLINPPHHSSAVRLDNPGMGGTVRRPGSSTESGFDIDVDLGPVPRELEEAERAATSNIMESPYHRPTPSEATIPEMYVEDPQEHIFAAPPPPPRDPSSIFDADLNVPAELHIIDTTAPSAASAPDGTKPGDSGIIECVADDAAVSLPSSDILISEATSPAQPRSAVIKSGGSAVMKSTGGESGGGQDLLQDARVTAIPSAMVVSQSAPGTRDDRGYRSATRSALTAWLGGALLGCAVPVGVGIALYWSGMIGPFTAPDGYSRESEQQVAVLRNQLSENRQQLSQTQEQLQNVRQELLEAQRLTQATQRDKEQLLAQLQQSSQQLQQVQNRLQEVERTLQTTVQTRKQLEAERLELEKNAAKIQEQLRQATAQRDDLQKQLQQAGENKKKLEADLLQVRNQLEKLDKQLQEVASQRQDLEKQAQQAQQLLLALAKELQGARLLAEQFDPPALLQAQRRFISLLNSKPEIQQLRQLEEDKRQLTATVQRLEQQLQQQSQAFAQQRRALQEQVAAELKRQREQLQAESQKLQVESQKLQEKLRMELQQMERQRQELAQRLDQVPRDKDMLQLWLQLLASSRQPTDVPGARQAAQNVLQHVDANSEEAAMAHLLLALAAVVAGNSNEALLELAKMHQCSAFEAARLQKHSWVVIAEQTRLAISDPLAPYRRPPTEQPKDPLQALIHLDNAIFAYRQNRFDEAVREAQRAVVHDPTHPIVWYYLGAAHWMLGQREQAADDFRQGSLRERTTLLSYTRINDLLRHIQGPVRQALEKARLP